MKVKVLGFLVAVLLSAAVVDASEPLDDVARLYADAFYEQALAAAERAEADAATPAADRHPLRTLKLLCQIALGRDADAQRTAEAMVRAEPAPTASETDLPPSARALLAQVRTRVVPEVARERYLRGRERFEQKAYAEALADFELAISLVEHDPRGLAAQPQLADLHMVATGFRDLARNHVSATPAPAAASPRDAAARPAAATAAGTDAGRFVPPEVVRQDIPPVPWATLNRTSVPIRDGIVEVTIDTTGRVVAARMITPIHPLYDGMITRAARDWKYRPALVNGAPATITKQLTIKVSAER
jgi:hypothetical protein